MNSGCDLHIIVLKILCAASEGRRKWMTCPNTTTQIVHESLNPEIVRIVRDSSGEVVPISRAGWGRSSSSPPRTDDP